MVSIIIPTYNRKHFLKEAIDSVLRQTYKNFELIIIDDGSSDSTDNLVASMKDNRIKYLYQKNKGVSAARNLGIKNSSGNYIALLDSDDLWLPEKLEKQIFYQTLNPNCKIHQTQEIWIRNNTRINQMKKHSKPKGMIYEKSLKMCLISPSSVFLNKSLFDKVGLFDESLPACEDYDMWLRITKKYPVGLIDENLIIKRGGHNGQLSHAFIGIDKFRIKAMLKQITSNDLNSSLCTATIKELTHKCKIYGNGLIKHGHIKEGFEYLRLIEKYN